MKTLTYCFLILITSICYGQEFGVTKDTLICSNDFLIVEIELKTDNLQTRENKITAEIVYAESTLVAGSASIFIDPVDLAEKKGKQPLIIKMNNDEYKNKVSKIVILLKVKTIAGDTIVSGTIEKKIVINVKHSQVQQYRYLAYVGTNFDLVDGIKAKNLFFATNVYLPPSEKWDLGIYTSVYGNRTMTFKDSVADQRRIYQIGTDPETGERFKIEESSTRVSNVISDNIGAYFSPLFSIGLPKFFDKQLKVFFSPSLEFLWRRRTFTITHSNSQRLAPQPLGETPDRGDIIYSLPQSQTISSNIYDFNMSYFGLFFAHENESISIRLHFSLGRVRRFMSPNKNYSPAENQEAWENYDAENDDFFGGKLWITERNSGITLQAEIINYSDKPNPFFGVTLSKALDFGKIGTIFSPLSRTKS